MCVCVLHMIWHIECFGPCGCVMLTCMHLLCFLSSPSHSCVLCDVDTGCEREQKTIRMSIVNCKKHLNGKLIAVFIHKLALKRTVHPKKSVII